MKIVNSVVPSGVYGVSSCHRPRRRLVQAVLFCDPTTARRTQAVDSKRPQCLLERLCGRGCWGATTTRVGTCVTVGARVFVAVAVGVRVLVGCTVVAVAVITCWIEAACVAVGRTLRGVLVNGGVDVGTTVLDACAVGETPVSDENRTSANFWL